MLISKRYLNVRRGAHLGKLSSPFLGSRLLQNIGQSGRYSLLNFRFPYYRR